MTDFIYIAIDTDMDELDTYKVTAAEGLELVLDIVAEYNDCYEVEVTGAPAAISNFITLWEGAHS